MSGINGDCTAACDLGRPHKLDCINYIEVNLPCPVCSSKHGRHTNQCPIS